MRAIKHDLGQDQEDIKIEIFSDLHIGSKKCDFKSIQEKVDRVAKDPHRYAILLGDYIDNATKNSPGDVYEAPLSPMQQISLAIETFRPIKDKILGIVSGNHERRSYKQDGIDLCYFLASELGLTDLYDPAGCVLFIRCGKFTKKCYKSNGGVWDNEKRKYVPTDPGVSYSAGGSHGYKRQVLYTMYIAHGDGSNGRTPGAKANALQRRGMIIDTDIVVIGHTHTPLTYKDARISVNKNSSTISMTETLYVNASATLNYEEYAELYGMKPTSKASPIIVLSHDHHEANCYI